VKTIIETVGGRKMLLGLMAIVGVVALSLLGDLPESEAVSALWKIVAAVVGGVALEDGLAKVKTGGR